MQFGYESLCGQYLLFPIQTNILAFYEAVRKAKLIKRVTCHTFRHSTRQISLLTEISVCKKVQFKI